MNIAHCPDVGILRDGATLPAGALSQAATVYGLTQPTVDNLWNLLLKNIYSSYTSTIGQLCAWKPTAAQRLLWRGQPVTLADGEKQVTGILVDVGSSGELILETDGTQQSFLRGSIVSCG